MKLYQLTASSFSYLIRKFPVTGNLVNYLQTEEDFVVPIVVVGQVDKQVVKGILLNDTSQYYNSTVKY